jgi:hypothetical protein
VVTGQGRLVVLEPEKWVGKRFPLLSHIDSPEPLDAGQWVILLYHHDCPACQELVPRFPQFARRLGNGDERRIALVEMPSYAEAQHLRTPPRSPYVRARLRNSHDWFAETPVAINVWDGRVAHVYSTQQLARATTAGSRTRHESKD